MLIFQCLRLGYTKLRIKSCCAEAMPFLCEHIQWFSEMHANNKNEIISLIIVLTVKRPTRASMLKPSEYIGLSSWRISSNLPISNKIYMGSKSVTRKPAWTFRSVLMLCLMQHNKLQHPRKPCDINLTQSQVMLPKCYVFYTQNYNLLTKLPYSSSFI